MTPHWKTTAVVLLASLLCASCLTLPTSSPVQPVGAEGEDAPLSVIVSGPQPGDSPQQIVQSFLVALSNPGTRYDATRKFLTPTVGASWVPSEQTEFYDEEQLKVSVDVDTDREPDIARVTLQAFIVGTLTESGVYAPVNPPTPRNATFTLAQNQNGWRITSLPDVPLMAWGKFSRAFKKYEISFISNDKSGTVPDVRWFVPRDSVATTLARALLEGPAPYLRGAATSAVPSQTQLAAPGAVLVDDSVAVVDVSLSARVDDMFTRQLMLAQFTRTLTALPDVDSVELWVDGAPLSIRDSTDPFKARTPASAITVVNDGSPLIVKRVSSGNVIESDDLPSEVYPGRVAVAVKRASTNSWFALAEGGNNLLVKSQVPTETTSDGVVSLPGSWASLSLDATGLAWALRREKFDALVGIGEDGRVTFNEPLRVSGDGRVAQFTVSAEGNRVATIDTVTADSSMVHLVGLERRVEGTPQTLSAELAWPIHVIPGRATSIAWISPTELVVGYQPRPQPAEATPTGTPSPSGSATPSPTATGSTTEPPLRTEFIIIGVGGDNRGTLPSRKGTCTVASNGTQAGLLAACGGTLYRLDGPVWRQSTTKTSITSALYNH